MNLKNPRRCQTFAIWAATGLPLILATPSFAELSYLDLKGVDAVVDHPGASPVHGYMALKTTLENRRFLGNYGDKNPRYGCLEHADRIHGQLLANHDCPQDFNS